MANVKCEVRNTIDQGKYDAYPFEDTDESPPCNKVKTDQSDVIEKNGFFISVRNNNLEFNLPDDKSDFFYALSSDSGNDNQSLISFCEIDVTLSGVSVNKAFECDSTPTEFLDFTCPKSVSKTMKFKDISECEGNSILSDLLSPQTEKPSNYNCFHVSDNAVNLTDISVPEACKNVTTTSSEQSSGKKELSSDDSVFNLSDILSSISIDDGSQSKSNSFKISAVEKSDQNLSLDDFIISKTVSQSGKNNSTEESQENLSDIFTMLDILSVESNKSNSTSKKCYLAPNELTGKNNAKNEDDSSKEGFALLKSPNILPSDQVKVNLNEISFGDFIGDTNKTNCDTMIEKERKKDDFSFFSNNSNSDFSFSQMLRETPREEYYSSSGDSGISMMDFLSSTDNLKESISSIGEDSDDKYSSPSLSNTPEEQDEELEAVDLNFCIKTFAEKYDEKASPVKDNCSVSKTKTTECMDPGNEINAMPLMHSVSSGAYHKKVKQSLFSKSLGCKSKRDPILIRKIADIKASLLNEAFSRPFPVHIHRRAPLEVAATYSDNPTTPNAGLRNFDHTGVSVVC